MKIAIMQPYFFPYIGYWQLINAVDRFVIYDDVNYINRGWINRNNILVNGKANYINIKMYKASQNKLINEISIFEDKVYIEKLLKTIKNSYKKAPYFEEVFSKIEETMNKDEINLSRFLTYSIKQVCDFLKINAQVLLSSEIKKDNNLRGQAKIIEICKKLNATKYINAIGGIELYSREDFQREGIELKFLKTNPFTYKQYENEFVPNLSIIDVMMFNSHSDIKKMLDNYELL
ncbi:MAG: WbqC family protein [Firmicutes bacterium]|nr:WbqC family protein [Bacillota bacterium]